MKMSTFSLFFSLFFLVWGGGGVFAIKHPLPGISTKMSTAATIGRQSKLKVLSAILGP